MWKRFSEFQQLWQCLAQGLREEAPAKLPLLESIVLPPKQLRKNSSAVVGERQRALETALAQLFRSGLASAPALLALQLQQPQQQQPTAMEEEEEDETDVGVVTQRLHEFLQTSCRLLRQAESAPERGAEFDVIGPGEE